MADFATRCGIDRKLMRREGQRLAKLAIKAAAEQARSGDYLDDERTLVVRVAAFVEEQAQRLASLVDDASSINEHYL